MVELRKQQIGLLLNLLRGPPRALGGCQAIPWLMHTHTQILSIKRGSANQCWRHRATKKSLWLPLCLCTQGARAFASCPDAQLKSPGPSSASAKAPNTFQLRKHQNLVRLTCSRCASKWPLPCCLKMVAAPRPKPPLITLTTCWGSVGKEGMR